MDILKSLLEVFPFSPLSNKFENLVADKTSFCENLQDSKGEEMTDLCWVLKDDNQFILI